MHFAKVIWAALLLSAGAGASWQAPERALPAPQFSLSGQELANAGFYSLSWSWPQGLEQDNQGLQFEVQQAGRPDFSNSRLVYRGEDLGTSFSGKADGVFYYRLRIVSEEGSRASPWSESYKVVVRHHPLSRALGLLALGALVFLSAAAVILAGHYRQEVKAGHTR